jgi:hypothetical protein
VKTLRESMGKKYSGKILGKSGKIKIIGPVLKGLEKATFP